MAVVTDSVAVNRVHDYDVVIVGAGAAGLMCAIEAGKRGRRVMVLDKARKLAPKVLIAGGGRCNFTNLHVEPQAFLSTNPHFCKSALARYTQWDFMALMEKHGLDWHEKTLGQLFSEQKSPAIVAMLKQECRAHGVQIELESEVHKVALEGAFRVAANNDQYCAQSLVIATGGPSIPRMGSTDFGVQIARQFGIRSIPFKPGLVPFVFSQADIDRYFKGLSGIALEVIISCAGTRFKESMLITHRGLSGPACLQVSSYWSRGEQIEVNLLPNCVAEDWLLQAQLARGGLLLKTVLAELLPKRLAERLADTLLDVPLAERRLGEIRRGVLTAFADRLNGWVLTPSGTEGMRSAEVSLGGVETEELSSQTMESRKKPGLYFVGETVDVTGWLGGYNLQWAWSSGWAAGQYV